MSHDSLQNLHCPCSRMTPFPGKKEPFGFGARLLLPLSGETLLRDFTSWTSVSFLVIMKLESKSEVTSWHSVGHTGLAAFSVLQGT